MRPSLAELVDSAAAALSAAGIDDARLDAELLLANRLGLTRSQLTLVRREPVDDAVAAGFAEDLARRRRREPLALIVGWQEFFGLRVAVRPGVLIPRWDTEPLVERLLEAVGDRPAPRWLADVGCGSGAVAVALAAHDRTARVFACDIAADACALTCYNAAAQEVGDRLEVRRGDLAGPLLAAGLAGRLDGLFANLPYLPTARLAELEPEVRDWEPATALDGGADGLDLYRRLAPQAAELLAPGGRLVCECDPDQTEPLAALLEATGVLVCQETLTELAGRPRGLLLRRLDR